MGWIEGIESDSGGLEISELILDAKGNEVYGFVSEGEIMFVNPAAGNVAVFTVEEAMGDNSKMIKVG